MFFNLYNDEGQLNNIFGAGTVRLLINASGNITSIRSANQSIDTTSDTYNGGKVELVQYTDAGVDRVIRSWATQGA